MTCREFGASDEVKSNLSDNPSEYVEINLADQMK